MSSGFQEANVLRPDHLNPHSSPVSRPVSRNISTLKRELTASDGDGDGEGDLSRTRDNKSYKRLRANGEQHDVIRGGLLSLPRSPDDLQPRGSSSPSEVSFVDAVTTMLSRADDNVGNRTIRLARGTPGSPAPARASPHPSSQHNNHAASSRNFEGKMSRGSQYFNSVALIEYLQNDERPIFGIDVVEEDKEAQRLNLIFANNALRARPQLLDCVEGKSEDAALLLDLGTPFVDFRSWVLSSLSSQDVVANFPFAGMVWKYTTVRKRLRIVTALNEQSSHEIRPELQTYKGLGGSSSTLRSSQRLSPENSQGYFDARPLYNFDVSSNMEALMSTTSHSHSQSAESPLSQLEQSSTVPSAGGDVGIQDLLAGPVSPIQEAQQHKSYITSGNPERLETMSMGYLTDKGFFDWTRLPLTSDLPEHIRFARSVDWASTSLGPIEEWSADLRGMCNLIMASPHPAAMYWGPEHVAIYNEAYIMLAGRKHPHLMGKRYQDAWAEIWHVIEDVFKVAMTNAQATMKDDDCLFMIRNGFLEETYFSWSIIPLIGDDGSVVGLYNPAFEKTRRKIAERRMLTLREIGERTASARAVSQFWSLLIEGFQYNVYDAPLVIIYSLIDSEDSDAASSTSSTTAASKVCHLEGVLGVEPGHAAAPARIDLKHDTAGFSAVFKKAIMADRPIVLSAEDGTLDMKLLEGITWRGFGDPSKMVVITPVRPTTGESTLGFLVMGTNPRRPYDEDYDLFVQLLGRQLATSVASVVLFEEEIRKGERAAQMAAQDRIELSNQLAARTQEAVESENKFTRMAELAPVGMFIGDAAGKITFANDAWYRMSGYPRDQSIADDWLNYVDAEDRKATEAAWTKMLKSRSAMSIEFRFQTHWTGGVGSQSKLWVIANASPETDEDGSIHRIFGSITDITSQKLSEALQKRRVEEAIEIKRQQERYIDTTSHEMRNPLSAILQSADSITSSLVELRSEADLSEPVLEIVESTIDSAQTITLCAQHQKRIVDDVLTLSKLDSAMLLVTPVDSQPVTVVHRALKMFEGELLTADIALDVRIDESYYQLQVDWVRLDPTRLSQVLINLTTNAIKFTTTQEKRTIRMHVAASKERPSQEDRWKLTYIPTQTPQTRDVTAAPEWGMGEPVYIHFAVQDTGRGLTEKERKQLFQRFSQANPRTHVTYGGSGLGLFISRELVELQGGEIGVASESGKGSTFAFYVKARRSQAPLSGSEDDMEAVQGRKGSKSNAGKLGPSKLKSQLSPSTSPITATIPSLMNPKTKEILHVLVVEDNLINQKVLATQLRKIGCIVYVANHGGEAIEHIEQSSFYHNPQPHPSTFQKQPGTSTSSSTTTPTNTSPPTNLNTNISTSTASIPGATNTAGQGQGRPIDISVVLMDLEMPVMDGQTCARQLRKMQESGHIVRHVPIIAVTANAREEQIRNTLDAGIDDVVSKPFRIPDLIPRMRSVIARFNVPSAVNGNGNGN